MEVYQIILIVIGSLLVLLLGFLFLTMSIIYKNVFKSVPELDKKDDIDCGLMFKDVEMPALEPVMRQMIQDAVSKPHEDLYVTSFDKLKLHGVLYRFGTAESPVMICFHGYRGNKFRDFAGAIKIFEDLKYNVLLVDQRAQHESEGKYMTFGVKEQKDVIPWVNKIIEIFGKDVKIAIEGLSMGGATVLMAAAFQKLPANVKCVVADCPFTSPLGIFLFSMRGIKIPKFVTKFVAYLTGKIYMGVNFNKSNAYIGLKNNKLPILIMHGEEDSIVPVTMSKDLLKKYPEMIELHTFKNANHGVSYFDDTERYWKVSEEFLTKHL